MSDATTAWPTQPVAAPEAGWFSDPASIMQLRWWDGVAWTDHTMAAPQEVAIANAPLDAWTPPAQHVETAPVRERRRGRSAATAALPPVPVPQVPVSQAATPYATVPVNVGWDGTNAPYVPFSQQFSPMRMLTPVRSAGSPNTPAIWLLALLPLILIPAQIAGFYTRVTTTNVGAVSFGVGVLAAVIALVIADTVCLRRRNLPAASPLWLLLLAPLVYFIARRVKFKKTGVTSNAPGNVFVLSYFAMPVVVYLAVLPLEGMKLAFGL